MLKSNWAQAIDSPPYRAYPVTGGITFTYGGLKISERAAVLDQSGNTIPGVFACGEIVGGVFEGGYPGGSGLTSGAVFGRLAALVQLGTFWVIAGNGAGICLTPFLLPIFVLSNKGAFRQKVLT